MAVPKRSGLNAGVPAFTPASVEPQLPFVFWSSIGKEHIPSVWHLQRRQTDPALGKGVLPKRFQKLVNFVVQSLARSHPGDNDQKRADIARRQLCGCYEQRVRFVFQEHKEGGSVQCLLICRYDNRPGKMDPSIQFPAGTSHDQDLLMAALQAGDKESAQGSGNQLPKIRMLSMSSPAWPLIPIQCTSSRFILRWGPSTPSQRRWLWLARNSAAQDPRITAHPRWCCLPSHRRLRPCTRISASRPSATSWADCKWLGRRYLRHLCGT
jgi:hypothetical protein